LNLHPCTSRFEEVTFQVDGTCFSSYAQEEIPTISSESSYVLHRDAQDWVSSEDPTSPESLASHGSTPPNSDESQSCPVSSDNGHKKFVASRRPACPLENTTYAEDLD
ncbi:hypothetical protein KI387_014757, partial [Taxus chinensis]